MIGIQDTSSETIRQLLGNGMSYSVPKFQRDYSWADEQWDDLWQDMVALNSGEESGHYMGYLVLQTNDNKNFIIIDGQQRLTTFSIFILAALKSFREMEEKGIDIADNEKRRKSYHDSYIGYLHPVTLVSDNKLKLNRNNNSFYTAYLVTLANLPLRGLNSSEKLMKSCFLWFSKKLQDNFKDGETLAKFIESLVDRLFFTVIKVSDDINAYKVFETLNARGVRLSSADLLKNYLFSIVEKEGSHETEIVELENLWSHVISKLGGEKFPDFLRIFWNSRNKITRHSELFKTLRKNILSKADAFRLVRELDDKSDLYVALLNPDDEFWIEHRKMREYLRELKSFGVKQTLPLLLTAYEVLDTQRFESLLRICSVISFRYNVIGGLNPNEQEKVYNDVSLKLYNTKQYAVVDFSNIYPNDDEFENMFANKEFKSSSRNNRIVKYILGKIESQSYNKEIDYDSERYTIEHILPENPDETWESSIDSSFQNIVYRLGNLTLLEKGLNKDAGNSSFEAKIPIYQRSSIGITSSLAEDYKLWNEEKIAQRQHWMAKQAKTIWKIS